MATLPQLARQVSALLLLSYTTSRAMSRQRRLLTKPAVRQIDLRRLLCPTSGHADRLTALSAFRRSSGNPL